MTRYLAILVLFFLAACGSLSQPFGKLEPQPPIQSIATPPWDATVKAGKGAANDIDLETLYGPAESAPEVAATETPVAPSPGKVEIKAVAVVPVKGAKGKGNEELTRAMRKTLTAAGWTVLNAPAENALTISGHVEMAPPAGSEQKVSLKWDVQTPDGRKLGDVKQANNVPAGSLDAGWGENAGFAAEAAATGIFELINKFR